MKRYLQIFVLLSALLWMLAWTAAGKSDGESGADAVQLSAKSAKVGTDGETMLRVLHGGSVEEMSMTDYLCGVLRAEMPASFALEALKAQAIAARTYTLYRMKDGAITAHPEADACDDIQCCKAYTDAETADTQWGDMAQSYEEKIRSAVTQTDGRVILYGDEPILAVFCSSVGGETQNAGAVWMSDLPYLQSVDSPESEALVPNYYSVVTYSTEELKEKLLAAYPEAQLSGSCADWITGLEHNEAGFLTSASVGGVSTRGNELRTALSLRSACFTMSADGSGATFHVTGYGHGVGMSQYGANILAQEGESCEEILTHYYTDTTIGTWRK